MAPDSTTDIQIVPCVDAFSGMVPRTDKPEPTENKNPDLSQRNRPVLGITFSKHERARR